MKTKIIIAAITLFLGAAIFMGCKKVNDQLPLHPLKNKIGYYHNEVLKQYMANNKNKYKNPNYRDIETNVVGILAELDSSLFNKRDMESDLKRSDEELTKLGIFEKYTNKNTSKSASLLIDNSNYFPKIIDFLLKNHSISLKLSNQLKKINTITFQNTNSDAKTLSIVNELKNMSWDDQDSKFVDVFVQVYDSSYSFWHNKTASFKSSEQVNDEETFMLADAAGALWGLWATPVLSIVEGAVFSTIEYANEQ